MKIIYTTSSKYPSLAANSVQVMKMCSAFSGEGIDVTLLAERVGDFSKKDILHQYGRMNPFEMILQRRYNIRILGTLLYLFAQLQQFNKQTHEAKIIYGRDPVSVLFFSRSGVSIVYESHCDPKGIKRIIEERIFKKSSFRYLVVISEALKEYYLKNYSFLTTQQVIVAPDAADPVVSNKSDYDVPDLKREGIPSIGYTGHLYKGKGIEVIVALAEQMSDIDFHIVGGEEKDVVIWKDKHDYPNLIYHGHINNVLIPEYLQQFDLLLLPAQKEVAGSGGGDIAKYMSPLKLFEYMSAGKAIIASGLPVLKEILTHRSNALLVEPGNISDWKQAITILLNDERLRSTIARKAMADFEAKYTWKQRARNIISHLMCNRQGL